MIIELYGGLLPLW